MSNYLRNAYNFLQNKNKIRLSSSTFFRLSRYDRRYKRLQEVTFNNHQITFNSPFWFLHSVDEIFVEEVYKFNTLKKEPVIIDCGANIGLSVLYFKSLYEYARIIAFEADSLVYDQLKKNIAAYDYKNIDLINAAVWTANTELNFKSEGSVGGQIDFSAIDSNDNKMQAIRLREYLQTKVDFLKIDIEGAEYAVLKDCKDLLGNVEYLFIEYHVMPNELQKLHEILQWVHDTGFTYYIKEAWHNMSYPFTKHNDGYYQMQLNISCYRQ